MNPASNRFIEEFVPPKWLGPSFSYIEIVTQVAIFLATLSADFLPADDDTEALKTNQTWRYVIVAPPVFFAIICLILLVACIP